MSTIKNMFVTFVLYLFAGIASVIGMLAGMAIWTSGLGDKVEEKAKKLFSK